MHFFFLHDIPLPYIVFIFHQKKSWKDCSLVNDGEMQWVDKKAKVIIKLNQVLCRCVSSFVPHSVLHRHDFFLKKLIFFSDACWGGGTYGDLFSVTFVSRVEYKNVDKIKCDFVTAVKNFHCHCDVMFIADMVW